MVLYVTQPLSSPLPVSLAVVSSSFSASWEDTEYDLLNELAHLAARDIVLELDIQEEAIRRDGRIRARAMAYRPGVRLVFTSRTIGPMVIVSMKYDRWQDNVRAIMLTLKALRSINRYGVAANREQYQGWTAIEP